MNLVSMWYGQWVPWAMAQCLIPMENNLAVHQKVKHRITMWASNSQKKWKHVHTETRTQMSIAVLFMIAKMWKHACMSSCFSCVQLFVTLWTVACQAPLPMGFSRQEYWSGLLCHPPGDLPNPGIKPTSLTSPALASRFSTTSATWEAQVTVHGVAKESDTT